MTFYDMFTINITDICILVFVVATCVGLNRLTHIVSEQFARISQLKTNVKEHTQLNELYNIRLTQIEQDINLPNTRKRLSKVEDDTNIYNTRLLRIEQDINRHSKRLSQIEQDINVHNASLLQVTQDIQLNYHYQCYQQCINWVVHQPDNVSVSLDHIINIIHMLANQNIITQNYTSHAYKYWGGITAQVESNHGVVVINIIKSSKQLIWIIPNNYILLLREICNCIDIKQFDEVLINIINLDKLLKAQLITKLQTAYDHQWKPSAISWVPKCLQ